MHTYVVDMALDEVVGLFAVVEVPVTGSTKIVNYTVMNYSSMNGRSNSIFDTIFEFRSHT